jgi:hypothetical protein
LSGLGVNQDLAGAHSFAVESPSKMTQFVLSQIVFGGSSLTRARVAMVMVAWVCGVASALYSGFLTYAAMDKVNERLPVEQRFPPLWWYAEKYSRLRREYRRLYPGGELLRKAFLFEIACFVCCLFGFCALYFR